MRHTRSEIESLNLDDLDVEELEHRLEMAMTAPDPLDVNCPSLTICESLGSCSDCYSDSILNAS